MSGKHLTNIACFRAYIEVYLKSNPRISKEHTIMARQLAPNENGLPIEIYAFTTDIELIKYEKEELMELENIASAVFLLDQKVDIEEFISRIKDIALSFNNLTEEQKMMLK